MRRRRRAAARAAARSGREPDRGERVDVEEPDETGDEVGTSDVATVAAQAAGGITRELPAGRGGVTTRRVSRRFTGSRLASTRMAVEKRSTDRVRATSSWCLSALGIR